ncbi:GGDEF domain-containing protein [uncultured Halopseudomonas sp.]|uniref:GGDEF domain-containing protein n=1 Tax=uncultured Halopseudomonas sp. TaxID=2901193 RepID=UPI0030EF2279|tara:strand:- start:76457 stop:77572 length:1116 start_codon:yes stop_codon:yes gene_type:complete
MENTVAKFQALRLQRFYLAQLNYAITYVVIGAAWLAGQYNASATMAASHVLLGVGLQGALFGIFKSGFNLRFKDPSLTSPQIVIAMLLLTYLLGFSGEFRGSLIMVYPIILMFGVFQLSRRAFLSHAGLALILYGLLILFNIFHDTSTEALSAHLLEWFVLACFMGWLSFFCSYIRELRERLQRRHNVLKTHQTTLRGMMGQLQSLADTDSLTGLVNRRYFLSEAERRITLLTPGQHLGIALIDLDNFKKINDLNGHAAGDEVLQGFARVALNNLRDEDMVARFGGEEFVLLLDNSDLAALHQCVERIRICFAQTCFKSTGNEVYCTLSAGLNLLGPGDSLEKVLNQADLALYRAKHNGRDRCEVYDEAYA